MTTATCRTEGCPANGITVPIELALGPDEQVFCGQCGLPTELVSDDEPTPTLRGRD